MSKTNQKKTEVLANRWEYNNNSQDWLLLCLSLSLRYQLKYEILCKRFTGSHVQRI